MRSTYDADNRKWLIPNGASHPVIYAPNGQVIGHATTERGAIGHASGIPKLDRERWTARLAETCDRDDMPDATPAWFVGPQLAK